MRSGYKNANYHLVCKRYLQLICIKGKSQSQIKGETTSDECRLCMCLKHFYNIYKTVILFEKKHKGKMRFVPLRCGKIVADKTQRDGKLTEARHLLTCYMLQNFAEHTQVRECEKRARK